MRCRRYGRESRTLRNAYDLSDVMLEPLMVRWHLGTVRVNGDTTYGWMIYIIYMIRYRYHTSYDTQMRCCVYLYYAHPSQSQTVLSPEVKPCDLSYCKPSGNRKLSIRRTGSSPLMLIKCSACTEVRRVLKMQTRNCCIAKVSIVKYLSNSGTRSFMIA